MEQDPSGFDPRGGHFGEFELICFSKAIHVLVAPRIVSVSIGEAAEGPICRRDARTPDRWFLADVRWAILGTLIPVVN